MAQRDVACLKNLDYFVEFLATAIALALSVSFYRRYCVDLNQHIPDAKHKNPLSIFRFDRIGKGL